MLYSWGYRYATEFQYKTPDEGQLQGAYCGRFYFISNWQRIFGKSRGLFLRCGIAIPESWDQWGLYGEIFGRIVFQPEHAGKVAQYVFGEISRKKNPDL